MALDFDSTTVARVVNHGDGASVRSLTAFTCMVWLQPKNTQVGNWGFLTVKGAWPGSRRAFAREDGTYTLVALVDRATTDADARTSTAMTQNAWNYAVMSYDGTDGPRAFIGSLSALVTEAAYTSREVGAGAEGDDVGVNLLVGGATAAGDNSNAWIASLMLYNVRLTLAQIQAQQFSSRPIFTGCVLFSHLGFNGTGTQPDWSGNGNAGTVTAATVVDHAPIARPFTGLGGWRGAFTAAVQAAVPSIYRLPRYGRLLGVGR